MLESKVLIVVAGTLLILLVDIRSFLFFKPFIALYHRAWLIVFQVIFWSITALTIGTLCWYYLADRLNIHIGINHWIMTILSMIYFSKTASLLVILVEEVILRVKNFFQSLKTNRNKVLPGKPILRSEFIRKSALVVGAIPFSVSVFGITYGAYDYHVRRRTIYLPQLPKAFDGIRIGQVSDIHCNPGYFKTAVKGGVEMLLAEKTDVVFFTGDLVNYRSRELNDFISIFDKIRAPLGVYSITGNHDYGDYISWSSEEAKRKDFRDFVIAHKELGYDLLMNEHRFLEESGERIAIIGIENWGKGRFPKYGKLDIAYRGTEEAPVKLLLSHDPSHWDLQVRPEFGDIDIMFAGHTHGFQMGVEIGDIKWSPAQYSYKQWADLYREGDQYLYVNRGFGCLGFLGRIGIPPEITVIELKRGSH